jgi:hypothetical protein
MHRSQVSIAQLVVFVSQDDKHPFGYGVGKIAALHPDDCLMDTGEPERLYHVDYEDVILILEGE